MEKRKTPLLKFFTLAWIFFHIVSVESKTKLGDIIPVCSLNDVNVDDCLKSSGQRILPTLAKGIRDWGLIGLDPIVVPSIIIGQDKGPISLKWENTNVTIAGFSKIVVKGASVERKRNIYNFELNVTTTNFSMSGDYKARGKMLLFLIRNEGHQEIHAGTADMYIKFTAKVDKRNKEEYLKVEKLKFIFYFTSKLKVVLKNRTKKPTQLDILLSTFINQNSADIVEELRPATEAAFGELIKRYIQRFFDKVPVKELFKN